MRRWVRWLVLGAGALLALVLVAAAGVWIRASRNLNRTYDVPLTSIAIPADSASIVEGERLARIRGCDGCHGAALEGTKFFDEPGVATVYAPDLTRVASLYSDGELERAIRHGVRQDGRSTWIMPSNMFYHLSDHDLGAILAWVRSRPVTDGPLTRIELGPLGRLGVATGQFTPVAGRIVHDAPRIAATDANGAPSGEYLARTTCTECHGDSLLGGNMGPDVLTPSLAMVSAYSDSAFRHFVRTGKALGERELKTMSAVARSRLSHLTAPEVDALLAYLRTLPATQSQQADP